MNRQSIADYDRALEIKPDYHEAWYNRGNALDKLGQYEQAVASFDRALEIKTGLP
jgi:tetratricopeptide (TPR) repeat protein